MSRQPLAGAAALSPQRYRALRARTNALLVILYERTSLTRREIALLAGRTERAVTMQVRALGCIPRNAKACRPGTDVGPRRTGPRPPPLNATATRRVAEAFAEAARELGASAEARTASELQRATARAVRRTAQAQRRVLASEARIAGHLAAAFEDMAAARDALAAGGKRGSVRTPAKASKPRSPPDIWMAQERVRLEQEAQMHAAHRAARQAKTAPAAPPASDADRRINEIAERYDAEPRQRPRIRGL